MNNWIKPTLSGVFSGIIAAGGTLTGAIAEMDVGANLSNIGEVTWLAIVAFGLVAAAKDWQAQLMGRKQ